MMRIRNIFSYFPTVGVATMNVLQHEGICAESALLFCLNEPDTNAIVENK